MAKKSTEHSPKFDLIKGWYDKGKWSKQAVANMVEKGWITAKEYKEITDEDYEAGNSN